MPIPPRLAHLATRAVLTAKLAPGYAHAHSVDDEEAAVRVNRALEGDLREQLLHATWGALSGEKARLTDDGLLEKVSRSLGSRPLRPGRLPPESPSWSAFWLLTDVAAGRASDSARRVLETDDGRRAAQAGLEEAGSFLAKELLRAPPKGAAA